MLTGAVVVKFGALSRHLPGGAEENREELQNTNLPFWNSGLFSCRVRNTSYSTAQGIFKILCNAGCGIEHTVSSQYCICIDVQLARLHRLGSAVTSTLLWPARATTKISLAAPLHPLAVSVGW